MTIVHSYAGALQADGVPPNLVETCSVSQFMGTHYLCLSPVPATADLQKRACSRVTLHLVLDTGCPLPSNYFLCPTM